MSNAYTHHIDTPVHYKVRSLFLSDIHLGTRNCRDGMLHGLLEVVKPDNLYLVGDIIDVPGMKGWSQGHENIMRRFRDMARKGCNAVYVPGNHDEGLRPYLENHGVGLDDTQGYVRDAATGLLLMQRAIHVGVDGRRHLVTHGDRGDAIIHSRYGRKLAKAGDVAYETLGWANRHYNHARSAMGLSYHALDGYIKRKFKGGQYMKMFRRNMALEAAEVGVDGVVCGHMHTPEIHNDNGLDYKNCGDMVASITGIVEDYDGRFTQLNWAPIYNAHKWAVQQKLENPSEAFACLAAHHGAVEVAASPTDRFNPAASPPSLRKGYVESEFAHLIRAASLDFGDKAYARRLKAARQQAPAR